MSDCFACRRLLPPGTKLQKHHVLPQVLGGVGYVWICQECHDKIHGIERGGDLSVLTRIGIARARARGVRIGRPPAKIDVPTLLDALAASKGNVCHAARVTGLSRSAIRRWLAQEPRR